MKTANNKKSILTIIIVILSISANGQMTGYKVTHDDPLAYRNLMFNFHIGDMDVAEPTTWRVGLGSEFTLNRRLHFFADGTVTPLDFGSRNAINKKQIYVEAGTMFSFSSVIKENKKFKLKFGKSNSSYTMKINCSQHRQRGIRAGVISFSTPKKGEDGFSPYSSAQSIFAGIGFIKTRSCLVEVDGHGAFDREQRTTFYIDAMISPAIMVKDNTDYEALIGSSATATPENFPDYKKVNFGYRMGWMTTTKRPMPFKQGFEFGSRPGIGINYYFLLRVSLSLGMNIGK